MSKIVRYRIYGIVDDADECGPNEVLEKIREYGTACVVGVELADFKSETPDAEKEYFPDEVEL